MTATAMKEPKEIKCYYCGKPIVNSLDHVIKKVPLQTKSGIRNYKRNLHLDCVSEYNKGLTNVEMKSTENSEWEQVFNYFRDEILGVGTEFISSNDKKSHMACRLLGLRVGKYYPSGTNTRILPRGYSFKTILVAMKVVNPRIQAYMKTANFTNFKHRVDGCMRFIVSEIPDVAKRMADQQKANEKLDDTKTDAPTFDYKAMLSQKKEKEKAEKSNANGTRDNIALLLGGSIDE